MALPVFLEWWLFEPNLKKKKYYSLPSSSSDLLCVRSPDVRELWQFRICLSGWDDTDMTEVGCSNMSNWKQLGNPLFWSSASPVQLDWFIKGRMRSVWIAGYSFIYT
jgi:hypothetical protein